MWKSPLHYTWEEKLLLEMFFFHWHSEARSNSSWSWLICGVTTKFPGGWELSSLSQQNVVVFIPIEIIEVSWQSKHQCGWLSRKCSWETLPYGPQMARIKWILEGKGGWSKVSSLPDYMFIINQLAYPRLMLNHHNSNGVLHLSQLNFVELAMLAVKSNSIGTDQS